jgi:hypothetical protein
VPRSGGDDPFAIGKIRREDNLQVSQHLPTLQYAST